MSNEEFENYVALMGKLLHLTSEQRDQISGELQDHMQMRVADLMGEGIAKPDAISQALEEFGDAAAMAKNFQTVLELKRRRWMMRFATYSMAGTFLAAVLTMAMWPDNARFGSPDKLLAQAGEAVESGHHDSDDVGVEVSNATLRTLRAEEALRKVVSLEYSDIPFGVVKTDLAEIAGLNFLLHTSAMDDSLTLEEPITFSLKEMPLNKALGLMLETKNATYVIDEGVIVIISLDDAEDAKWFRRKMYDCRELVKALADYQVLQKLTESIKSQVEKGKSVPSSEQTLLDLVQSLIQPESWQDTGQGLGQVKVVNGILVVLQTEEILQEVENFVADLEGNVLQRHKRSADVHRPSSNNVEHSNVATGDPLGSENPFGSENPLGTDGRSGERDPFGK